MSISNCRYCKHNNHCPDQAMTVNGRFLPSALALDPKTGYCRHFEAGPDEEERKEQEAMAIKTEMDSDLNQFNKDFNKASNDDPVNNPAHYCRDGAMETIEEMELVFGTEAVKTFCVLNAWKYRARALNKNGLEDLKKSDWYLKHYKELLERETMYKPEEPCKNTL